MPTSVSTVNHEKNAIPPVLNITTKKYMHQDMYLPKTLNPTKTNCIIAGKQFSKPPKSLRDLKRMTK